MKPNAALLLSAILPALSAAARLTITISPNPALQNPSSLPSSAHAILSSHGEPLKARLTRSNTFEFANVPPGSHLLTVQTRDVLFENLRVDVAPASATGEEYVEAWTTWRGNEWDNKGEIRGEGQGRNINIEVRPLVMRDFYYQRSHCKLTAHGDQYESSTDCFS